MENQSTGEPQKENGFPGFLIFITAAIIFSVIGYYYGINQKENPRKVRIESSPASLGVSIAIPQSTLPVTKVLNDNCVENKISVQKLPFSLSDSLKIEYSATDTIVCARDVGYAYTEHISDIPATAGADKSLYFYDQNLITDGPDKTVKKLSSYPTVTINDQTFGFELLEKNPFGIVSPGVWINLIREKRDPDGGNMVQIVGISVVNDQNFLELVKKYGDETVTAEKEKIFVVNESNKEEFKLEIMKLAPTNETLIKTATELLYDLERVSF